MTHWKWIREWGTFLFPQCQSNKKHFTAIDTYAHTHTAQWVKWLSIFNDIWTAWPSIAELCLRGRCVWCFVEAEAGWEQTSVCGCLVLQNHFRVSTLNIVCKTLQNVNHFTHMQSVTPHRSETWMVSDLIISPVHISLPVCLLSV